MDLIESKLYDLVLSSFWYKGLTEHINNIDDGNKKLEEAFVAQLSDNLKKQYRDVKLKLNFDNEQAHDNICIVMLHFGIKMGLEMYKIFDCIEDGFMDGF